MMWIFLIIMLSSDGEGLTIQTESFEKEQDCQVDRIHVDQQIKNNDNKYDGRLVLDLTSCLWIPEQKAPRGVEKGK